MLTLFIHHNIYLTHDQRYELNNSVDVETMGVSVPVWAIGSKTSEPGREVYCKYYISNPKKEIPIKILKDGYLINLPYRIPRKQRTVSNDEWRAMSQEQREAYYTAMPREMSAASLLDIQDGGSESLMYREANRVKSSGDYMRIVHYVNFFDMKYLEGSMQYVRRPEPTTSVDPDESDASELDSGDQD